MEGDIYIKEWQLYRASEREIFLEDFDKVLLKLSGAFCHLSSDLLSRLYMEMCPHGDRSGEIQIKQRCLPVLPPYYLFPSLHQQRGRYGEIVLTIRR